VVGIALASQLWQQICHSGATLQEGQKTETEEFVIFIVLWTTMIGKYAE